MSGKNTTFPDVPSPSGAPSSLSLSLLLAKVGSFLLLSTPKTFSIMYLENGFFITQFERGAVELASQASVSDEAKNQFALIWPFLSTSSCFTFAIIIGMSMSIGQISLQRPHEIQR